MQEATLQPEARRRSHGANSLGDHPFRTRDAPQDVRGVRFNEAVGHHSEERFEDFIDFALPLDEVDDDRQMQSLDVACSGGVELTMSTIPGISLNRGRTLNPMLSKESKNIVGKKAMSGPRVAIEMDGDLERWPGFQHSIVLLYFDWTDLIAGD